METISGRVSVKLETRLENGKAYISKRSLLILMGCARPAIPGNPITFSGSEHIHWIPTKTFRVSRYGKEAIFFSIPNALAYIEHKYIRTGPLQRLLINFIVTHFRKQM